MPLANLNSDNNDDADWADTYPLFPPPAPQTLEALLMGISAAEMRSATIYSQEIVTLLAHDFLRKFREVATKYKSLAWALDIQFPHELPTSPAIQNFTAGHKIAAVLLAVLADNREDRALEQALLKVSPQRLCDAVWAFHKYSEEELVEFFWVVRESNQYASASFDAFVCVTWLDNPKLTNIATGMLCFVAGLLITSETAHTSTRLNQPLCPAR
jgi:hypothetical protein